MIHADLARALYFAGRADEAVALYQNLITLDPGNLVNLVDLGRSQRAAGDFDEALKTYRQALLQLPNEVVLLNNIGNCHLALCEIDAAIECFQQAIAINPDFVDAHHNLGLALLTAGRMKEGWQEHRWRLRTPAHLRDGKPIGEWDGSAMPSKVLLVLAEQGHGDTIHFCRHVKLIAPRARVVLAVQPALRRLMDGLPGTEQVVTDGDPSPVIDAQCALMSLPRLLGAHIAADADPVPYLRADPAAVIRWRQDLSSLPGPKVGLCWAGSPGLGTSVLLDRRRSLALAAFAPLKGPTFISLQKGPAAAQAKSPPAGMALVDWTEELRDFADTAALIEALDLVISVDTAVAHLAGALGRPIWMLNRTDTDWRWGVSGETTSWYPTMRLFRQTISGDWAAPISAIAAALQQSPFV